MEVQQTKDFGRQQSPTPDTGSDNGPSGDGVFTKQTWDGHTVDYPVMLGCNFTVKVDRELMIEYVNVTHMCVSKNLKRIVF